MKKFFPNLFVGLVALCLASPASMKGQLTINNAVNAADGVPNVLLGNGITVSNITFNGQSQQVASFNCVDCNLGLETGLIMGSGNVDIAPGPNTVGSTTGGNSNYGDTDADLAELMNVGVGQLHGACVIQFDFVPTGDSLAFEYIFASEEYSEFLGYGDVFGFFLSGPGISGPFINNAVNLAVIPGTSTAVSVPNINNGPNNTGPCVNCSYFNWNGPGGIYGSDDYYIEYDGFTDVFVAQATVQCGETYHIKLAIADWADDSWDCAVFLKAGSFASNQLAMTYEAPNINPVDSLLYEGCSGGNLSFIRPQSLVDEEQVYFLEIAGTAENGIDYDMIPDSVVFPLGVDTVFIPVNAILDGITEGEESIQVTITSSVACADDATLVFYIGELDPLAVFAADQQIECGETTQINLLIQGGIGTYNVDWSDGQSGDPIVVTPDVETTYQYTVTDGCTNETATGDVVIGFVDYDPLTLELGPEIALDCLDLLVVNPTIDGGSGTYVFEWVYNGELVSTSPVLSFPTNDEGTLVLTIVDACGTTATDEVEVVFPPVAVTVDLGDDLEADCNDVNELDPDVAGGVGSYSYAWLVDGVDGGSTSSLNITVSETTVITLVVTDLCENTASDEVIIVVPDDPLLINLPPSVNANCVNNFSVTAQITGGAGSYTYAWTDNGQVIGTNNFVTYQTDVETTLTITVSDECGHIATDEIDVVFPPVAINVSASQDQTICPTDEVAISASANGGIGNLSYSWSPQSSSATQITVDPMTTTVYTVTVQDACGNTGSQDIVVNVLVADVPLTAVEDLELCMGVTTGSIAFGGISPYSYDFDAQALTHVDGVGFTGNWLGTYTVVVYDACYGVDQVNIEVKPCSITIPNIFTPNHDADNQTFFIEGLVGFPGSGLKVFDRWGHIVYDSANYENNWDGGDLESGVYYYSLSRSDGMDFEGYVHLVRLQK